MEEILKQILSEIGELKQGQAKLDQNVTKLDQGQQEILLRLDKIEDKLDDLEIKNAKNHLTLLTEIQKMQKDFIALETITGKNMQDISHLKAVLIS